MAYPRPTLKQLVDRTTAAITGKLSLETPALTRAVSTVLALAMAGVSHGLHGLGDWLWRQIFPALADYESVKAEAASYGIYPHEATFAGDAPFVGSWSTTGTNGTSIPVGTEWSRADGTRYISTTSAVVSGGTATVIGRASVAGIAGNADAGTILAIVSPIIGLSSSATVVAMEGGTEEETEEGFRTRFLEFLEAEGEIGADADWIRWAKSVAGVTRAWVFRHEGGLGRVVVRFVRDNDAGSIIPSAGEVTAVQGALDANRPTTAEPEAVAPIALAVAHTIAILPDTPEKRATIAAELDDLFFRRAEPGDGAGRGTVLLSEIRTAIGVVSPNYTLTIPSANIVPTLGELATRGTLTWI